MMSRSYRLLLVTFPRWWRERNADVVLGTLLEVHAAAGRRRPTMLERAAFFGGGLSARLRGRRPVAPPPAVPLSSIHLFDQTNGASVESQRSEREQIRANASSAQHSAEDRVAAMAWIGINAMQSN